MEIEDIKSGDLCQIIEDGAIFRILDIDFEQKRVLVGNAWFFFGEFKNIFKLRKEVNNGEKDC